MWCLHFMNPARHLQICGVRTLMQGVHGALTPPPPSCTSTSMRRVDKDPPSDVLPHPDTMAAKFSSSVPQYNLIINVRLI